MREVRRRLERRGAVCARRLGLALGGAGKKNAGVVVTAGPLVTAPKHLKKRGVAGVTMPSTITHCAYAGKEGSKLKMLQAQDRTPAPHPPAAYSAPSRPPPCA